MAVLNRAGAESGAMGHDEPDIALSEPSADEIKTTTCYMCACRCGIRVHLKDGRVRYIDGNRDHPVNKGVLCGKGSVHRPSIFKLSAAEQIHI
jgi:anaerobic selenocysteine-containing dehydrogenase